MKIKEFRFEKNLSLLDKASSLGFKPTGPLQPDVEAALSSDSEPFPSRDIVMSEIRLEASTPLPIEFGLGRDKVSFTAQAGRFSGFGVFRTGHTLLSGLGDEAEDLLLSAPEFGCDGNSILSMLRWGYAAGSKSSGAMALGAAGKAALNASREGEGLFAVIRRVPAAMPARDVVQKTADSWILPRQINSAEQVPPGTWIMAEAVGMFRLRLESQLGYRFNWVRETGLGGLSGDLGLRLQAGILAEAAFSSGGRCAMVISRNSDQSLLRLRLFRLKSRQLDVSLDARLSLQALDKLLPDRMEGFLAAVFGCHGQQILRDLRLLEQWNDPAVPLPTFLMNAGLEGMENLVACMAGVSAENLHEQFDAVHTNVVRFLVKWHDLPHKLSSALLSMVEEKADLGEVCRLAHRLGDITPDGLRLLLNAELSRAVSFRTPTGQLLEAAADDGALSLLSKPISYIQGVGRRVSEILDGDAAERVLMRFQSYLETELNLVRAAQAADDAGFARLDAFLKCRLAQFLGLDRLAFSDLQKIRDTMNQLSSRRQELYDRALEALHRKYVFEWTAACRSGTSREALLDVTFDFSVNPESVSALFRKAVEGNFEELLTAHHPQVKIGLGKLTHGIRRQTEVEVTMPFLRAWQSHVKESVAVAEVAEADGELLFTLKSADIIAGNQRKSILSLVMNLPGGGGVRIHEDSMEMNYTLLYAKRDLRRKNLRIQAGPAVETYFKAEIPDVGDYIEMMDRRAEEVLPNGPDLLGNGLISLRVSFSQAAARLAGHAWLNLPADLGDPLYGDMSIAIQASLKRHIHECYFTEPEKYQSLETARLVLAYCALVPACRASGNGPLWDYADPGIRRKMLNDARTVERMERLLVRAQAALAEDPDFCPSDAREILANVDERHPILDKLLWAESQLIRHAVAAGLKIAEFRQHQSASPSRAVAALAEFGAVLTEAFHASITPLLGAGLRSLGTRIFLDVSRALSRGKMDDPAEIQALLSLELLKANSPFDERLLLKRGRIDPAHLAIADRVVHLGVTPQENLFPEVFGSEA